MFGFLKKSLKQAVEKVAKAFQKEETLPKEELPPEKPAEEIREEITPVAKEEPRITEEIRESAEKEETVMEEAEKQEVQEEKEPLSFPVPKEKPVPESKKAEETEEKLLHEMKEEIVPESKKAEELELPQEEARKTAKPEIIIEKPAKEETREEETKKKPGLLRGLLEKVTKKVTEKTLSAGDVDKFISELQVALLENDVALETAEQVCSRVKGGLVGKSVRRADVEAAIKGALKNAMLDAMKQEKIDLEGMIKASDLTTVIFFGFNGAGKTTTIAKLAHKFRNCKPVVAAGDTFRAASIEQLEEHSGKAGFDLVKHNYGADSAAVIFDAKKHAAATGSRLVLADTAGRSHSNANLMDELKKVVRVNKPDLKVLVLDSVTGNDIYDQSKLFNDAVGVDAIILTKADVYEKGGAALSAAHTIGKPILYLGTGQGYDDLIEFDPEKIVKNLVDYTE